MTSVNQELNEVFEPGPEARAANGKAQGCNGMRLVVTSEGQEVRQRAALRVHLPMAHRLGVRVTSVVDTNNWSPLQRRVESDGRVLHGEVPSRDLWPDAHSDHETSRWCRGASEGHTRSFIAGGGKSYDGAVSISLDEDLASASKSAGN